MNQLDIETFARDVLPIFRRKQSQVHLYDRVVKDNCTCPNCVNSLKEAMREVFQVGEFSLERVK